MTEHEMRKLIEQYLKSYNAFDIDGMMATVHPEIAFQNVSDGQVTATATGAEAFRQLAEQAIALFTSRCQTITAFAVSETGVSVDIVYEGLLSLLWLIVMGQAIARSQPPVCSPTVEYRGERRHSGINIDSLPTEFDLSDNLDAALTERLSRTLHEALAASGAPGVTAAVGIPGEGLWSETVGLATTETETPLTDASVFWWASVGKLFTASVILQQVAEAQLTLNQTIDTENSSNGLVAPRF